jgi:succinate-acetate transporter protein
VGQLGPAGARCVRCDDVHAQHDQRQLHLGGRGAGGLRRRADVRRDHPLLAGLIQLRTGNTFAGVLFSGFGAFWLSLFAIAEFFLKEIPANQVGHALGLFLYAFGLFVISMTIASFRTNAIVVAALVLLIGAFFALGAGNYGAHTGLVHIGGYLGLGAAALALYLSCAETCEATYGRSILPVWSLKR